MTIRGQVLVISLLAIAVGCGPTRGNPGDDTGDGPTGTDSDGDGYTDVQGDCNDNDAAINPGANEQCEDGIDNNCNQYIDHADPPCMTPCERAAFDRSSVGCVYYGVDTNSMNGTGQGGPYAIAVSNIDPSRTANVVIEQKLAGSWSAISGGSFSVPPRALQTVVPPRQAVTGSLVAIGGVYRVTSDLPVIAYQFAPVDGSASYLSDASLLLPAASLDNYYIVSAWPQGVSDSGIPSVGWPAHIQITPIAGGSNVTVTSSTPTLAGSGVPALTPGVPQSFTLEEGDFLQLTVANFQDNFNGTYIEASNPVAVFSSNDCADVPNQTGACCCEHLEEQLFGLQTWGTTYVAAQMPRRNGESSIWHITAQEDATTLSFTSAAGVTGLPTGPTVLNARQELALEVSGGPPTGADFYVQADKPIHVNQFTVGSDYPSTNGVPGIGDPDMIQAIPTEQYLQSYVVLVPATWVNDFVVLTRRVGAEVIVDGVTVTAGWTAVGTSGFEATRYPLADGVHVIDGTMPFGVSVSGYDPYDSYSYPGGLNQTVINPIE
jgi:hypothetical protein